MCSHDSRFGILCGETRNYQASLVMLLEAIFLRSKAENTTDTMQIVGMMKITGITFSPARAINSIFEVSDAIKMDRKIT